MPIQEGNYGRLLEPGLRKVFFNTYNELPPEYSRVFRVQDSQKAVETDARLGGFGLWDEKDSQGSTKYAEIPPELDIQYIPTEFSKGFIVEEKMVEDEQYNVIKRLAENLARGARATVETQAANVLNNAFVTNGYDGQPLVATAHTRLDKGATVCNKISGALTDKALKQALILSHQQVDDAGILIQMAPKLLVVPPQLEYTAKTIVGGSNLSPNGDGTLAAGVSNAATDKNVLQNGLQVVVMNYLLPTDGTTGAPSASGTTYPWFLIDPTVAQLNFFWRKRLQFKNETDFDTDQYKYKGKFRMSVGYSDFRGLIASPGF